MLSQKTYLATIIFPLDDIAVSLFDNVEGKTINAQWIVSTTQPHSSRQRKITRKSSGSWCYKEINDRHPTMH